MASRVVMYPSCNEDVSTIAGVRNAVRKEGREIFAKAEARLAAHRQSGNARVEFTDTKYYPHWGVVVSLIDEKARGQGGPGALGIEFGHFIRTGNFPRYVEGLYILTRSAGLM